MRKFCWVILLIFMGGSVFAQDKDVFEYVDRSDEIEEIEVPPYIAKHYLGPEFTKKFFALKEQYTYTPEKTPLDRDPSPETEKPIIYNSVKKLDRYYKKLLKKGEISKEEAAKKLSTIVAVGYSIRYAETEALEKILWKTKDPIQLESIFIEKIILN